MLYIIIATVILLVAVGFYVYKNYKSQSAPVQPYFEMTTPTYKFTPNGTASVVFSLSSVNGGYENLASLQLDVTDVTNTAMFKTVNGTDVLGKLEIGKPYTLPSLYPGSSYIIKLTATNKSGDTISKEKTIKIEKSVVGDAEMSGSSIELSEKKIKLSFPDASKVVKMYDGKSFKSYDISVKKVDQTDSVYYQRIEIPPTNPIVHEIDIGQFQPETEYDFFISSSDFSPYKIGTFVMPQLQPSNPEKVVELNLSAGEIISTQDNTSGANNVFTYRITTVGFEKLKTDAGIIEKTHPLYPDEKILKFNIESIKIVSDISPISYVINYGDDGGAQTGNVNNGVLISNTSRGTSDLFVKLTGSQTPVDQFTITVEKQS
jgi:hypothetical protein